MATVHARKRGNKWEYRFEAASIGSKRKQICKSGYKTKAEAMDAGVKAYNEYMQAGTVFCANNSSLSDYFDYWLKVYGGNNLKPITLLNYEKKIKLYIKPYLGKYRLSAISAAVLQEYINERYNEGFSRNTLSVLKGILSKSFTYAVEPLHYLQTSPMVYVNLPAPRAKAAVPTRTAPHVYIPLNKINEIFQRFPEESSVHIPLMLGYKCGLRLGEAFGVMWSDVDFINKTITVNRQVQWAEKEKSNPNSHSYWYFSEPKYGSMRTINIDDELAALLMREKSRQERAGKYYADKYIRLYEVKYTREMNAKGEGIEIYPVCRREDGGYIQPRTMQHASQVIHHKMGYEDFDFHSLRHTHATNLSEAGAPPKYVQQRLGHRNIQVTMQIYQHCTDAIIKQGNAILHKMYHVE